MAKRTVIEAESAPEAGRAQDFDIVEMPLEGVAAYWLSIKKLSDMKRGRKFLSEEAAYTEEPFVRHLLEIGFDPLGGDDRVRAMAAAKAASVRRGYERKFAAVTRALGGMADGENPRLTLIAMNAAFPRPPLSEERAMKLAAGISTSLASEDADRGALLPVSQRLAPDRLVVKLLFYCMQSRRGHGPALKRLLPHAGAPWFVEGLRLVMDGFDREFVERIFQTRAAALLDEASAKMDMSVEMFMAIRGKLSYDQVYLVARSCLP